MFRLFMNVISSNDFKFLDFRKTLEKEDRAAEIFNDGPYTFAVEIDCSYSTDDPYYLEFNPMNPTALCTHECQHCGADLLFKAITVNDELFVEDISFLPIKERSFWDERLCSGISTHKITVVKQCENINKDKMDEYYKLMDYEYD